MARSLDGTGLVHINMSSRCRQYPFVEPQNRIKYNGISLRAAHQKMHFGMVVTTQFSQILSRTLTILVQTVTIILVEVDR